MCRFPIHRIATLFLLLGTASLLHAIMQEPAQAPADPPSESKRKLEVQQLRNELKEIEARLDALEATQPTPAPGAAAQKPEAAPPMASPGALSGPAAVMAAQDQGMDTMDAGMGGEVINIPHLPELKIRGFGDVRGYIADQNLAVIHNTPGSPLLSTQGGESTFALGIMDLFVTSQISPRFSYLSEIGFEADAAGNGIGVDLERAQISFVPNDKFAFVAGRTHAMLGYYNTAFHHGTWFQTTIDRPRIFEFEDSGGPLPIHNVGVSAMGRIPSGKLGLHWFAELGNGKQTYSVQQTVTPANVLADHNGKATNLGLFLRPERWSGLQTGFDWYQGSLVPVVSMLPGYGSPNFAFPNAVDYYRQDIFVGHFVYITPTAEFMVEDAEIRDLPRGSTAPLYTSGGYAQVSKAFHSYRPYLRYEWLNPNFHDPNNAWVGRTVGPDAGLRWDLNTFVAFKAEYSRYDRRQFSADSDGTQVLPVVHKTINQLGLQLTYTF